MSKRVRHYPPVGSDDRLEAIMSRGTGIRRRRQAVGAASAGLTGIACIALVAALGSGIRPAEKNNAVAGPGAQKTTTTTSVPEEDPTPTPRRTPSEDDPFVSFETDPEVNELRITVNDAKAPIPTNPAEVSDISLTAQQCVTVTVTRVGDAAAESGFQAEGFACRELADSGASAESGASTTPQLQTPFELRRTGETLVGCRAIDERVPDGLTMTQRHEFTEFATALDMPAGDYKISISAVSGFGDGCPPGSTDDGATSGPDESGQVENTETITGTFTVR